MSKQSVDAVSCFVQIQSYSKLKNQNFDRRMVRVLAKFRAIGYGQIFRENPTHGLDFLMIFESTFRLSLIKVKLDLIRENIPFIVIQLIEVKLITRTFTAKIFGRLSNILDNSLTGSVAIISNFTSSLCLGISRTGGPWRLIFRKNCRIFSNIKRYAVRVLAIA